MEFALQSLLDPRVSSFRLYIDLYVYIEKMKQIRSI